MTSQDEQLYLVEKIEDLFAPDDHEDGRELLLEALCSTWRQLPLSVLRKLLQLNIEKDAANTRRAK